MNSNPVNKQYLGDSVYVAYDDGLLVLTTENGLGPSNVIYLDVDVWRALVGYVERLKPVPPPPDAEPEPPRPTDTLGDGDIEREEKK